MKNLRKHLFSLLLLTIAGCSSRKDVILTPGVGMEGCKLGMKSVEINDSIRRELVGNLLFDADDKLMMIVNISNPSYFVESYGLRAGDNVKMIPKDKDARRVDEGLITEKFSFGRNDIDAFKDGVIFAFDEKGTIKAIFITETTDGARDNR